MTLDDLVKLSERATDGPWMLGSYKPTGFDFSIVNNKGDAELGNWLVAGIRWEENAALITASVNLIRSLCDPKVQEAMARAQFAAICLQTSFVEPLTDEEWGALHERKIAAMRAAIQALIGANNV